MIRIATTGPESSGKTSLSLWLQNQLAQSRCIPEYARAYLSESNGVYSASDLIHFAEQLERELRTRETTDVMVADTDFYVLEIWFSEKFPGTINPIREYVQRNSFDLYLLCAPDLAWEPDPLRENPNDRDRLFERYEQALIRDGRQYAIITGNGELRTRNAAAAIRRVFPELLPPDRG
ncbi:MAG: AAA family ATPase [Flavobacteriales bacterium]